MKKSNIFWRRKGKSITACVKIDGKSIDLFTLPNPDTFIEKQSHLLDVYQGSPKLLFEVSFFSVEKLAKIRQKLGCLENMSEKEQIQT